MSENSFEKSARLLALDMMNAAVRRAEEAEAEVERLREALLEREWLHVEWDNHQEGKGADLIAGLCDCGAGGIHEEDCWLAALLSAALDEEDEG